MKIILFVLLFAVVLMSGCTDKNELAGNTYTGPDGDTVKFFENGKMHYTNHRGDGSMGVYTIEEGRVYYNAGFWSWDADIVGDTLVNDNDGDTYIMTKKQQ